MAEWLVLLLLVPAVVLPVVYLLGFAGCSFQGHGSYPPLVITNATATGPNTAHLEWTGGYAPEVEFQRDKLPKPGQSSEPVKTFVVDLTSFATDDGGLSADSRYRYMAREIYMGGGQGPWSAPVDVDTPAIGGPPPSATFDAISGGHTDTGFGNATTTWTHTASGPAPAVVVGVRWSQAGGVGTTTRTVTYGGVEIQSLGVVGLAGELPNALNAALVEFFGVTNPPTGPQVVSVTVDRDFSQLSFEACSLSYAHVSAFGPATTPVSGTEAGTSMTQPVNSAVNEMVLQMFGTESGTITGYNQTTRHSSTNGLLIGDAPGAASISFTANRGSGVDYAGVAVRLVPIP